MSIVATEQDREQAIKDFAEFCGGSSDGRFTHIPATKAGEPDLPFKFAVSTKAELIATQREVERLEGLVFSPTGDNHHNANACPYCREGRKSDAEVIAAKDKLLEQMAEALRDDYHGEECERGSECVGCQELKLYESQK